MTLQSLEGRHYSLVCLGDTNIYAIDLIIGKKSIHKFSLLLVSLVNLIISWLGLQNDTKFKIY